MTTATVHLPTHAALREALVAAQQTDNGGLGFHMWAAIVNRDGIVITLCFSGELPGDQWPGSRIIAATKANTANAFSLDQNAMSTARLYSAVQPGGPLFGLGETAPVNIHAAYGGDPSMYGTTEDHMLGKMIGGMSVFGGGLPLYDDMGHVIGGLGVSGDLSCADHNIAWKVRHALELDFVPGDDNIVYDLGPVMGKSSSGWGHPKCNDRTEAIGRALPQDFPPRRL